MKRHTVKTIISLVLAFGLGIAMGYEVWGSSVIKRCPIKMHIELFPEGSEPEGVFFDVTYARDTYMEEWWNGHWSDWVEASLWIRNKTPYVLVVDEAGVEVTSGCPGLEFEPFNGPYYINPDESEGIYFHVSSPPTTSCSFTGNIYLRYHLLGQASHMIFLPLIQKNLR